ncbi:MAG: methyltransferase domain-containing protein [Rhodocyclaceae bacterium]|nr:methyltransferase domain-containing protein [Rhodocyclaceae bacterium]
MLAAAGRLHPDDALLVDAARRACLRIGEQSLALAHSVADGLRDASIPCAVEVAESRALQYHLCTLSLAGDDPTGAVDWLKSAGFWCPASTDTLHWESFRLRNSELTMCRLDDASSCLRLRWQASRKAGRALALRYPLKALRSLLRRVRQRPPPAIDTVSLGELRGTPRALMPALFEFAALRPEDVVVDIGCGDGRVLIEAARRVGCRGIGIEAQAGLCAVARERISEAGLGDRIQIRHDDSRGFDGSEATVIFLFVPVRALSILVPEMLPKLAPSGRIIAHEQVALGEVVAPDRSAPLIGDCALTVAHLWR